MNGGPPEGTRPTAGPSETTPGVDGAWSHRPELIHYARRMLGGQGDLAEDVVQEAYLRLHEQAAAGSPVAEARPWLFRVTRNLAIDERRRSQRGDVVRTSLEIVASRPRGPLEVLQGREEARQALTGLDALPPRERRAVILDQAGLPPRAIARRMQTTTNAVHQSLFRARRRMRDARAAAWGLLPLPIIRLMLRTASAPSLDRLPAVAPGSGGRLAGGAGLVGLAVVAVVGGGVVADQPVIPHPAHERSVGAPAVTGPAPGTMPAGEQASMARPAPPPVTAKRSTVAVLGRPSRARGGAREAPESEDGPDSEDSGPIERADREVEDQSEPRSYDGQSDRAEVRREHPDGESHESRPAEGRPSQVSSGSDRPGEDDREPEAGEAGAREPEAREPEAPEAE